MARGDKFELLPRVNEEDVALDMDLVTVHVDDDVEDMMESSDEEDEQ